MPATSAGASGGREPSRVEDVVFRRAVSALIVLDTALRRMRSRDNYGSRLTETMDWPVGRG